MRSDDPNRDTTPHGRPQTHRVLRESDELWLRRGERLGELVLTSRAFAYGWAAAFGLVGASLVLLALLGMPEAGTGTTPSAGADVPPLS